MNSAYSMTPMSVYNAPAPGNPYGYGTQPQPPYPATSAAPLPYPTTSQPTPYPPGQPPTLCTDCESCLGANLLCFCNICRHGCNNCTQKYNYWGCNCLGSCCYRTGMPSQPVPIGVAPGIKGVASAPVSMAGPPLSMPGTGPGIAPRPY